MARRTILITGASGFVGTWLQRELGAGTGDDAVTIHATGQGGTGAIPLDVRDADAVAEVIRRVAPSAVVHLAAIAASGDARRDPELAWDVNLGGTLNLARAVLAYAPSATFIYVSSGEVYGESFRRNPAPLDETAALEPTSSYGATKAAADIAIGQMAHDGLRAVRFRPFNHTGPGQEERYAVPGFARQVAEAEAGTRRVIEVGNLSAVRDFLDVRDVIRAYARAALDTTGALEGRVFNLCSGVPRRMGDILDALIATAGVDVEVRVVPQRYRENEIERAVGSGAAAEEALHWHPEVPFAQTIGDVLAEWRQRTEQARRLA